MDELFPVFDVPEETNNDAQPLGYLPGPLFDTEIGDFVYNGANQAVYGTGYDTWVLWCTKTIITQRWAHLGYTNGAGVEANEAFRQPDRAAQESAFIRTITEALLSDPAGRTQQVMDFEFNWNDNSLRAACTVIGKDGSSAAISANIII